MKTLDGYDLREGESCYVSAQCATGMHNLSATPRNASYLDKNAKRNGWDFTIPLRVDCEEVEIVAVWKHKPVDKSSNIVKGGS